MRSLVLVSTVFVLVLGSVGCGGDTDPIYGNDINDVLTLKDLATGSDADEDLVDSMSGRDESGEAGLTDLVVNDLDTLFDDISDITRETTDPGQMECPGNFGCSCDGNDDCFSGRCIETMMGWQCTKACVSENTCPTGWKCSEASIGGDTAFICVEPFARLCRPCVENEDCIPAVEAGEYAAVCISSGDVGSFCGLECGEDGLQCPDGFECADVEIGSSSVKQCVPEGGAVCECYDKNKAFLTECYVSNDFGTCWGERTCDSECSAEQPAGETCNQIDDDCDGKTDEGIGGAECDITNEYGACKGTLLCIDGDEACQGTAPKAESCGNGIDDDCDGATDEEGASGCTPYFLDTDSDTYGVDGTSVCLCKAMGQHTATRAGDCNDSSQAINPGVIEECNSIDDDCDGGTDEEGAKNCKDYYRDDDGDTYGQTEDLKCLCAGNEEYSTKKFGDCNDDNIAVSPGENELCNDGIDDDCDGSTDEDGAEDCTTVYLDVDRDTYGLSSSYTCKCEVKNPMDAVRGGDCNDDDPNVNGGVTEICNDKDDDCDGSTDEMGAEGCSPYYIDFDGDEFGLATDSRCLCKKDDTYKTKVFGDCNDKDPAIYPNAVETCNNKDDDCDGSTDEPGAQGCLTRYLDNDYDGFGQTGTGICLCSDPGSYGAFADGDCDDGAEDVYPGRTESCNGRDDDCDGKTDEENAEGCAPYYNDVDDDGYGVTSDHKCLCVGTGSYDVQVYGDCCDSDPNAKPLQTGHFSSTNACGNYDYNCSGVEEKFETRVNGGCEGWNVGSGCDKEYGWRGSTVPACGVSHEFLTGGCGYSSLLLSCKDPSYSSQVQTCH